MAVGRKWTWLVPFQPDAIGPRRWPRLQLLQSIPLDPARDPLRDAIANGLAAGSGKRQVTQEVRKRARAIRDDARAKGCREAAITKLLEFVADYPGVEEFQKIIARLLREAQKEEQALFAWLGVSLRFPNSMAAFHNLALLVHRRNGPTAVKMLLEARFVRMPIRLDQLLAYAEACDLAEATAERRAAFERLGRMFKKRNDSWLQTASWLEEEFGISKPARSAATLLRRLAAGTGLGPGIVRERKRLHSIVSDGEHPGHDDKNATASVKVLGALFDRVLEQRQATVSARPRKAGPAVLLTGSLGAGGAERQLVTTAIGLNEMNAEERTLSDGVVLSSVDVMARSLRDRKDGSFFLGDLQRADVLVRSYRDLPDFAGNLATSAVRPALSALGYLPWSTAEAVIKLTDWLQATEPEVVHIWQDGLVYAAGFAALLAGVPRIVLSGRSAPPPDRRERYPIEYDIIYRSLLRAPGVKLSVNSHYAASRYAAWLGIGSEEISVVPNGVARLPCDADSASEDAFDAFEKRTPQSTMTLGAVMRLDEVKRPLLWVEAAASLLGRMPNARFVIVGDGPFRAKAERRAEALGVAGRCLFVGRSGRIGYWLSKMDALMLLSEHEGLPNALIEAQLAGVPVITSAAGGAPETLISGKTGIITRLNPTPTEVADMIAGLATKPGLMRQMGIAAEQWAQRAFPISRMLLNTLEVYSDAGRATSPSVVLPSTAFALRPLYQDIAR